MEYYSEEGNKLYCGDCLDVMRSFPDNHVTGIVTDPPYFLTNDNGSGFMGKDWDGTKNLWRYLWEDSTNANIVENYLKRAIVEVNLEELSIVQESANMQQSKQSIQSNANTVESYSTTKTKSNGSALLIVLTKQGLLDLLSEISPSHTKDSRLLSGIKRSASFAIPLSLPRDEHSSIVRKIATTLLKAEGCKEREISFTKTEIAKIKNATEVMTGISYEKPFIKETIIGAEYVTSIVVGEKFNATTLSPTEKLLIIQQITLLFCAMCATRKSSKIQDILINSFLRSIFREAIRVLKPGGTLLCFSGSRTQHVTARNIEAAGFSIRDCMLWVYGSGFPKSYNIGKGVDKKLGNERVRAGISENDRPNSQVKGGRAFDSSFDRGQEHEYIYITKGNTIWEGYGTALKPAYEPIIIAMKPNDGGFVDNALKYGVAGINIDGCRVDGTYDNSGRADRDEDWSDKSQVANKKAGMKTRTDGNPQGRFPANIILDEEAGAMMDEQSGVSVSSGGKGKKSMGALGDSKYGKYNKKLGSNAGGLKDKGGASRFFKQCKYDKEDMCYNQLNVNIAGKNLSQQKRVEGFVLNLAAIGDIQEGKVLSDIIARFMKEIKMQSSQNSRKNMQPMKIIGEKYLQELKLIITERLKDSPVKYAEIQLLTNTMMIIQNLLSIDGFAGVVTSNSILSNMAHGEKVSRIKYCAKASKSERNAGCEDLPTRTAEELTGRKLGSKGLSGSEEHGNSTNPYANGGSVLPRANHHPTVKPLSLMTYLTKLVKMPKNTLILDPFAGSGSTLLACIRNNINFIGIEMSEEYCDIAKARIESERMQLLLDI